METDISFRFILILFLFSLSGFFASSESALFSLTSLHLHKMREERIAFHRFVRSLLEYPRRLLITIIVSNEIVNILLSSLIAAIMISEFGNRGAWIAILVTTPALLIFGEIIPKTLAKVVPIRFAAAAAPVLSILVRIEYPLVWILDKISGFFIRPLGRSEEQSGTGLEEAEFKTLIDMGLEEGVLDKSQRDLIHRVFELGDTEVSEIMTPRVDMFSLSIDIPFEAAKKEIVRRGYSRVPVYGEHPDDIRGILYSKDLLAGLAINGKIDGIGAFLHKPCFVPLERKADSMFKDFQVRKIHMAIVVDEYGGIAGLVTMEDILESLFGDIYDERDVRERTVHRLSDRIMIVSGTVSIEDLNNLLGTDISSEDFDTVGGYVLNLFGKLPVKGEEVTAGDWIFRIEKIVKARIMRIRITRREKEKEEKRG
ncbi:MAG: hemolysin family protein [Syntrophales bacterium]|nr:hemolysin family protein [Syntrophales bacterium]MDD5232819.1 hemolysin family protein [Syntrophales bacterium]